MGKLGDCHVIQSGQQEVSDLVFRLPMDETSDAGQIEVCDLVYQI